MDLVPPFASLEILRPEWAWVFCWWPHQRSHGLPALRRRRRALKLPQDRTRQNQRDEHPREERPPSGLTPNYSSV